MRTAVSSRERRENSIPRVHRWRRLAARIGPGFKASIRSATCSLAADCRENKHIDMALTFYKVFVCGPRRE